MKSSVALIGFMGSGKTAVGRALAARLGKEFIELDEMIEKSAGKTIANIFAENGELRFRELEIEATREIAGRKNVVIASGGGLILNRINLDRLRRECIVIYLTASPGVLLKRLMDDEGKRPLLKDGDDRPKTLRDMLQFRRPLYEHAADITVDTSKHDINGVVEKILQQLAIYHEKQAVKEEP